MTSLLFLLMVGKTIRVFASSGQVTISGPFHVDHNLGLINARILGGNEARGDFLAFIDAHVFVSPRWLNTPYRFLSEVAAVICSSIESENDRQLRQLQAQRRHLSSDVHPRRNWQLRFLHVVSGHFLGRRLQQGRFLADHDGHVFNVQVLVEHGANGHGNGSLGRREH